MKFPLFTYNSAKIHFHGFNVFTGKKVEENFFSHEMMTVCDSEKFSVAISAIDDATGVVKAKCGRVDVVGMRLPPKGALRDAIVRALRSSASVECDALAVFGQRGVTAIVGAALPVNDISADEDEVDASSSNEASNEAAAASSSSSSSNGIDVDADSE